MHPIAPSSFSPPTLSLNLGTIGRLDFYRVEGIGGPSGSLRDKFAAIAAAHPGLPRPPRDLDCDLIPVPECPDLLVLAAVAHHVAYFVIANLANRSALTAMRGALKAARLELVLASDNSPPWWSAMWLEGEAAGRLAEVLQARKDAWRAANDQWRDKLGMLLTQLPTRFARHDARALRCTQHAVVLADGNRSTFRNAVDRCALAEPGVASLQR